MIPSLKLQEAIRARLLNDPAVARHVSPDRIRMGDARPEEMPTVIMSPSRAEILGYASAGQIVAEVRQLLNIWAHTSEGNEPAHQIAHAVLRALMDAPAADGFAIDRWDRPVMVWVSARLGDTAHAAISLRAEIRWSE